MPSGTARDISEQVDVPRTRVYEAMRALEEMGLIQIQHSTPQEFQAAPIQEATTIRSDPQDSRSVSRGVLLSIIYQSSERMMEIEREFNLTRINHTFLFGSRTNRACRNWSSL
ncbi:MAG: helix-turn-helix domain-containing protein [Halobacteriales archaeon]